MNPLNPVYFQCSRPKWSYLLIDAVLNAERVSQRRVKPNVLAVSERDRLRVIADGEPWIRVANVRRYARIERVEVRDTTRRRVHNESGRFHVDAGRTLLPVRRVPTSQLETEHAGDARGIAKTDKYENGAHRKHEDSTTLLHTRETSSVLHDEQCCV